MKKFLEYVAEDIIRKYGTDLSRIAVVFPNKRASLFLNELLAKKAGCPIWSPAYITISDFFRQHSDLAVGDSIKLICDMHKSFTKCTGIDEPLDHFFGWGQLLLADFDDIDKNMADAEKVFKNVENLHELDDISYLDEQQKDVLRKFFVNFTGNENTELRRRFLQFWCRVGDIYNDYRERLRSQGVAYEGMLYREVAENPDLTFRYDTYLFVGFNVIQSVEQRIFMRLKEEGKGRFYWDFDKYYMPKDGQSSTVSNEAGHYVSQFIRMFPDELDVNSDEIYNNLTKDKTITYVSASTENVQARYINTWLKENKRYEKGRDAAIILCNEALLSAAIHCIPDEVGSVNITTGYPLLQTPVASFVMQLMELRINGYSPNKETFRASYVLQVLSHPYSQYVSGECDKLIDHLKEEKIYRPTHADLAVDDNLALLFNTSTDRTTLLRWLLAVLRIVADNCSESVKDPITQESLFRMYTLCNRLNGLIASGELDVNIITLQKLILQLTNSTSIPFHGEPAIGVQIMGILETRNLDFDHVLILSCNEGNMPKGVNDSSFIPYAIRKAYGLTTIDNKVAIYAYYFYNLLQRASDITVVYNNSTEGSQTGEMSRFMLQLMVESGLDVKRVSLHTGRRQMFFYPQEIAKDGKILDVLRSMDYISPTAVNRYMRCPLQFYYNSIAGIKESDDDNLEEMDNRIFGNLFHNASEILYKQLAGNDGIITEGAISAMLKDKTHIGRIVDEAFINTIFENKSCNRRFEYNGLQLINREVIIKYLCRLLDIDKRLAPFRIADVERSIYKEMQITTSDGSRTINIGGRIDRLDQIYDKALGMERIRVIDYKTGSSPSRKVGSLDDIFTVPQDYGKHADYFLQTMLYAMTVRNDKDLNPNGLPVSPALMFIQNTTGDDYDPTIVIGGQTVTDIADYESDFADRLSALISEIYEPEIPFRPASDTSVCGYCPYCKLCKNG